MKRMVSSLVFGVALVLAFGCNTAEDECTDDDECDDGIYCNGAEICERTRYMPRGEQTEHRVCGRGTPPCEDDSVCREEQQQCVDAECALRGDLDGDGHVRRDCGGDDCDDDDPERFPGNAEVCDLEHHDEDCDALTYGARDSDGDGFDAADCCNEDREHQTCGVDCDDERAGVHPSAVEACNEADDDCDGAVDETMIATLYADTDGDGHGDPSSATELCADTPGYAAHADDCDDTNPALEPGAQRCLGGQSLDGIQICGDDGAWVDSACGVELVCITQPNGTGICR